MSKYDDDSEDELVDCIKSNEKSSSSSSEDEPPQKKGKKKKERIEIDVDALYNETMDFMEQFKEKNVVSVKKKENTTLPWVEKFRPKNLDEIISHHEIVNIFKNFIKKKQFPHMILRGPPGTGKTSAIMACAKELYGENYNMMVLVINASAERGIEVVRNKITDFISTKAMFVEKNSSAFKLVILDESDAMTTDAQAMLVSVIEKSTLNVRFCLICNYIKKISPAIQSRCTPFKFSPLKTESIIIKLKLIANDSKLRLTDDGIETLIKISKGDMRKILNILQATSMGYSTINSTNVTTCIGYPTPGDIKIIYNSLNKENYNECYKKIGKIISSTGYSLIDIISELTDIIIKEFMDKKVSQKKLSVTLTNMRNIETNLTLCPNEKIQLSALVGLFCLANN